MCSRWEAQGGKLTGNWHPQPDGLRVTDTIKREGNDVWTPEDVSSIATAGDGRDLAPVERHGHLEPLDGLQGVGSGRGRRCSSNHPAQMETCMDTHKTK